jgi:hypothetical protein
MAASTCCAGLGRSGRCRSARGDVSRHIFLRHLCASAVPEHESCVTQSCVHARVPRRVLLASTVALLSTSTLPNEALAFDATPSGYSRHNDILDGYTFVYPDGWLPVTTSGNDTFYRNPRVADENVFVDISSPSSSKFTSVDNLGSPDDARQKLEKQFLKEYMSTRLGVRRETQPLYAEARTGVGLSLRIEHWNCYIWTCGLQLIICCALRALQWYCVVTGWLNRRTGRISCRAVISNPKPCSTENRRFVEKSCHI